MPSQSQMSYDLPSRSSLINGQLKPNGIIKENILNAFLSIPRERFCPSTYSAIAYSDASIIFDDSHAMFTPITTAKLLQKASSYSPLKDVATVNCSYGYTCALLLAMESRVTAIDSEPYTRKIKSIFEESSKLTVMEQKTIDFIKNPNGEFDFIFIEHCLEEIPYEVLPSLKNGGVIATLKKKQGNHIAQAVLYKKHSDSLQLVSIFETTFPLPPIAQKKKEFSING